jgi:hypothetical protein
MQGTGMERVGGVKIKILGNWLAPLLGLYLVSCSPFMAPATAETETLLNLALLAGVDGDCAVITQVAADDYKAEIYPVGSAGCNRTFIFGSSYNNYAKKELRTIYQVESFLQSVSPSSCSATLTSLQAVKADPMTNPLLVAQATIDSYIEYRVIDGPQQGKKATETNLIATASLSAPLANSESKELIRMSLPDYENLRYLALASVLSESEPGCNSLVRVAVNRLLPGWMYNEKVDLEYPNTDLNQIAPRFLQLTCVFGSANTGDSVECDNLQI